MPCQRWLIGTRSGSPVDAAAQDRSVGRVLGVLAGVVAWVGWLTICPALGFPTLATAGMLNRVLVPREDPGSWLGWALLVIGLASAALLYPPAVERGRVRRSIASGMVYGAICWLLAGAVVMPLLGLAAPLAPTPAPPGPPDPMRGSFMMLHLGVGAPVAALVAWLNFGALVGATAGWRTGYPFWAHQAASLRGRMMKNAGAVRTIVPGGAIVLVIFLGIGLVISRLDQPPTGSAPTTTRMLARGAVQSLPDGPAFVSIIELPQAPGSTLGPHAHVPGFAYSLDGVETITFHDGRTIHVGPGEAGFMGAQAPHSHLNVDGRRPAAALAVLIVAITGAVCVISARTARGSGLLTGALALLIAAGALAIWDPWSNDWLFLAVRPVAARGAPMPLPTASRSYESSDLGVIPPGPYVETLEEVTVAPSPAPDVREAGSAVLLVLEGWVEIQPAGETSTPIGVGGATLIQPGESVRLANLGDRPARLLRFAVVPAAAEATPGG